MEHCIVTPELVHLYRNGGVGTNSYYLAQFLSRIAGHKVTILYTQQAENIPHWKEVFQRECNAQFVAINETDPLPSSDLQAPTQLNLSLRIHQWLNGRSFDVIHFQHYLAAGFCAFQAKRLGLAYQNTHLICIANSPSQWINEGMERYPSGNTAEIMLDYMERYCAEHCDTLLSPSQHLIDWMRAAGWSLCPDARVIRSYLPAPTPIQVRPINPEHLVFYGRLETRKGIKIFTQAAIAYARYLHEHHSSPGPVPSTPCLRLSYLGRPGQVGELDSDAYLSKALQGTESLLTWQAHTNFGHHQALEFIEQNSDALFVFPAAMDSFAFAVNEGAMRGVHQLVSSKGGVSEFYLDDARKFNPTPENLFAKLCEVHRKGLPKGQLSSTPEQAAAIRLEFVRELELKVAQLRSRQAKALPQPLISVCIPYFNFAKYLPETLECLSRQTYPHFEVVVVDYGSTCDQSRAVFAQLKAQYESRGWKFISKPENTGASDARNFGVKHSTGQLLAFVDADNLPRPEMLERLNMGLQSAGLDAVTCNVYAFQDGQSPTDLQLFWAFLGGCIEASLLTNTVGDTNMLVRKSVFEALGGFKTVRDEGASDRAFLLRLLFAGYRLDCISAPLFAYRRRAESLSKQSSPYLRQQNVLEVFTQGREPWLRNLFHHKFGDPTPVRDYNHTLSKLIEHRQKHLLERDKRRQRDRELTEYKQKISQLRSHPLVRLARALRLIKV